MYRFEFYFHNATAEVSSDEYTSLLIGIYRMVFGEPATAIRSYIIVPSDNGLQVKMISESGKILYLNPTNRETMAQLRYDWNMQLDRMSKNDK